MEVVSVDGNWQYLLEKPSYLVSSARRRSYFGHKRAIECEL